MSNPTTINWLPSTATANAICLSQNLADEGYLTINGPLSKGSTSYNPIVEFVGVERTVSITSSDNMSNVNFTISGYIRGEKYQETLAGPVGPATVSTQGTFDVVTSVYADGAITNTIVGLGNGGSTVWILPSTFVSPFQLGLSITVTGIVSYTFQATYDNPLIVLNPTIVNPLAEAVPATAGLIGSLEIPVRAYRLLIGDTTTGSIIFSSQQAGVS